MKLIQTSVILNEGMSSSKPAQGVTSVEVDEKRHVDVNANLE